MPIGTIPRFPKMTPLPALPRIHHATKKVELSVKVQSINNQTVTPGAAQLQISTGEEKEVYCLGGKLCNQISKFERQFLPSFLLILEILDAG